MNLFNLASHGQCNVDQIASHVIAAVAPQAEKRFTGGSRGWKGDVSQVQLDGSRLQKMGFRPRYNSEEAVAMAVRDILSDPSTGIS